MVDWSAALKADSMADQLVVRRAGPKAESMGCYLVAQWVVVTVDWTAA